MHSHRIYDETDLGHAIDVAYPLIPFLHIEFQFLPYNFIEKSFVCPSSWWSSCAPSPPPLPFGYCEHLGGQLDLDESMRSLGTPLFLWGFPSEQPLVLRQDISLSARIIANFPDYVRPAQRVDEPWSWCLLDGWWVGAKAGWLDGWRAWPRLGWDGEMAGFILDHPHAQYCLAPTILFWSSLSSSRWYYIPTVYEYIYIGTKRQKTT